jgi:putative intracellular protease/amidase
MRNLPVIAILLLYTLVAPPQAQGDESGRIFMFVRDGSRDLDLMLRDEVNVMKQMLEDAGYQVDVATTNGQPLVGETLTLTPDVTLDAVDLSAYKGVALPCMAPAADAEVPQAVLNLLSEAVDDNLPIAASRGSVAEVGLAGGLKGRNYAYARSPDPLKRPEFADGNYLGTGVVRDGNLATAGICPLAARSTGQPDGTAALTQAFLHALAEAG